MVKTLALVFRRNFELRLVERQLLEARLLVVYARHRMQGAINKLKQYTIQLKQEIKEFRKEGLVETIAWARESSETDAGRGRYAISKF